VKAWPIDPLAFRDLKLEVSEKFNHLVVDFKSQVIKTLASQLFSWQHCRTAGSS